jgi:hypothetical protein
VFWNPASDAYYVLRTDNGRWQWYRAHRRYEEQLAPNVTGRVRLQGRAEGRGAVLTSPAGPHTASGENGAFGLHYEGQLELTIRHPGYLDVVAVVKAGAAALDMGEIVLLGGDMNGDNRVDILDVSYIGSRFGTADARADVNGDGTVDILDLSVVGANFGRTGPIRWER